MFVLWRFYIVGLLYYFYVISYSFRLYIVLLHCLLCALFNFRLHLFFYPLNDVIVRHVSTVSKTWCLPACIRGPACNRDPASISTICLDPRPVSGTRLLPWIYGKVYADMSKGSIGESIFATYTCFHIPWLHLFSLCCLFSGSQTERHVAMARARAIARTRPPSLAGCWVDRVVRTSKQKLVDEGVWA